MPSLRFVGFQFLKGTRVSDEVVSLLNREGLTWGEFVDLDSLGVTHKALTNFSADYVDSKPVKGTYFEYSRDPKRRGLLDCWFTLDRHGFKYHLWHYTVGLCHEGEIVPLPLNQYLVNKCGEVAVTDDWSFRGKLETLSNRVNDAQKEAELLWILHRLDTYVDEGVRGTEVDEEFSRGVRLLTRSAKRMIVRDISPSMLFSADP